MPRRAGIVLCGGRSSRMGRPKAWLPWFGRTLVEHVVEQLRPAVDELIVVTSQDLDLPPLDARIVRDREPERGPLAGLRDGLAASKARLAFVTSTDAPFLTADHVDALLARGESRADADAGACAPIDDGHVQVLSAVYPVAAHALAAQLLEAGARRPLDLLERLDFEALEASDLKSSGGACDASRPPAWQGFNTPAAYLAGVRRVDPEAAAEVELLGRAALHSDTPRRRLPVDTLGALLAHWPASLGLVDGGRVAPGHLVSLGGRDLVRDLSVPVGPDERVHVIDAQAGG